MNINKGIFLLCTMAFMVSCNQLDNLVVENLNGKFEGTFERVESGTSLGLSEVSLEFEGNTYSGSHKEPRYPVICNGSYNIENSKITFSNNCFFTADFDWSLILNGEFDAVLSGQKLILTRSSGNFVDTYKLIRVE
ncbi:hypothetical protein ACFOUP_14075 [Belliella kenyensis]|uniref:Lipocalin-like domain-containing protein n=1 Tax=Belliella kenyensis TaxID=1472724 RepID=A0ABV8EPI2_9BACT|nr:hypothetical protein [Belliella kenyensis]MCH7401571.1 hypothetical protein [Belliella kenyensis]MDN3603149.1 hypothetical protein [Belliella kenyensis]